MTWIDKMLEECDIRIDGDRPWDVKINHEKTNKEKFFSRIMGGGTLAIGESYMDGWWDSEKLDETTFRLMKANFDSSLFKNLKMVWDFIINKFFNLQNVKRAFQVAEEHYDIGNDLYDAMLDKSTKSYTCGYWKDTDELEQAQINKLDLICRKLQLKPGDRVLEIGCGWGNFMKYACKNYGVKCVGLTVSKEQVVQGRELLKGVDAEFVLTDYREYKSEEKFDKIVSIGMFEHVGAKNYNTFMQVAERNLKDEGLFLLHTIGNSLRKVIPDPWITKYIFPNGFLPAISHITEAFEGRTYNFTKSLFQMEDWHNFGPYYDLTLISWWKNFDKSFKDLQKNNPKYTERFYRMWKFYLLTCAALFRARKAHLWQIVFSKKGVVGGYTSIR